MLEDNQYYILSSSGKIIDYDDVNNKVYCRDISSEDPKISLRINNNTAEFNVISENNLLLPIQVSTDGQMILGEYHESNIRINYTSANSFYRQFNMNGFFLSSQRDGKVDFTRVLGHDWETFRLLKYNELKLLHFFCSSKWLIKSKKQIFDGKDIQFLDNFRLKIDNIIITIDDVIESIENYGKKDFFVFNGWIPEEFILYNPLVYYCCFGKEDGFKCLDISINSLRTHAQYEESIIIISEKNKDYLEHKFNSIKGEKIKTIKFTPLDHIDFMSARFDINNYNEFSEYQPILYLDTDVIAQSDINNILLEAISNMENSIHVFTETNRPDDAQYWGKDLFHDDPNAHSPSYGFSTGLMLYRNIPSVGNLLTLIRETIFRQSRELTTRQTIRCFDQPVANYIIHKLGEPESKLLDANVKNFDMKFRDASEEDYGNYANNISVPLLHFAGGVGAYDWKLGAMQRHAAWLEEQRLNSAEREIIN